MKAREVMNRAVVQVGSAASVRSVADLMRQHRVGIVCVCDEQRRPLGVVTDRDIVIRACAAERDGVATTVQEIMSDNPLTCQLGDELTDVGENMERKRASRSLVVDEEGRLVGIISLAEIWHYQSPLQAAPLSQRLRRHEIRTQSPHAQYVTESGRRTVDETTRNEAPFSLQRDGTGGGRGR